MKGYTDNLTIINIDQQSHKKTLPKVDSCCSDFDLQIRADIKCVPKTQNIKVKAKLSLLVALNRSTDHLIQDLLPSESCTLGVLDIPAAYASIFKAVSESVTSLPALKKQCKEQRSYLYDYPTLGQPPTNTSSSENVCRHSSLRGGESLMEENHEKQAYQWSAVHPPQGWLRFPPNPYEFTSHAYSAWFTVSFM